MNLQVSHYTSRWAPMSVFLASLFFSMPFLVHAETLISGESTQVAQNTFGPMQPVIRTQPVLPTSRPDKALAYPNNPVSITLPVPKPELEDVMGEVISLSRNDKRTCGCIEDLYHNILLPNGDVSLCCMDYNLEKYL